ncbi:MAG: class I SAM-dependent methyltransferase [Bryobacteraceae bacterium]
MVSRAGLVLGMEPFPGMLSWARTVVPEAHFLAARTEALPVAAGTADLMTAAGSLNYCEPAAAFREIMRVLASGGAICVYDFSQGGSARDTAALAGWFDEFRTLYPIPPSEAIPLDPKALANFAAPLAPGAAEHFEMEVPMDAAAYEAYIMTESTSAPPCAPEHLRPTSAPGSGILWRPCFRAPFMTLCSQATLPGSTAPKSHCRGNPAPAFTSSICAACRSVWPATNNTH